MFHVLDKLMADQWIVYPNKHGDFPVNDEDCLKVVDNGYLMISWMHSSEVT